MTSDDQRTGEGGGVVHRRNPGVDQARRLLSDWLPGVPFVVLVGVAVIGSVSWLTVESVRAPGGGWTMDAWSEVLRPGLNRSSIVNSLKLSVTVATICAVIGTPLAWHVAQLRSRRRRAATAVVNVAANFDGAPLAVALVATFGTIGFLRLLVRDLLHFELPVDLYGFWGLVGALCYFTVPLYVLFLLPAMSAVRPEWWEAAQTNSASRVQFWRFVGAPVLAPFVMAGWALSFAWAIGQFTIVYALIGTDSAFPVMTQRIGTFVLTAAATNSRYQRAAALSVLLIVITGAALLVYRLVARRYAQWLMVGAR
jgi:putative spermidine/putrescine transport system permease protein